MLTIRKFGVGLALLILVVGLTMPTIASAERRNHHNHNEHNNQQKCREQEQEEPSDDNVEEGQQFNSLNRQNNHHNWRKICATAEPATFDPSTCGELGSYTIVESTGVDYTINGETVAPGTYTVANGTTVTIVAVAQEGYAFEPEAVTTWTYTFNAPTNCATPQVLSATTTTATPQVTAKPTGGVSAGAGGATAVSDNRTAAFGLFLSIGAVAFGFVRKMTI